MKIWFFISITLALLPVAPVSSESDEPQEITKYSGQGSTTTRPFQTQNEWLMNWERPASCDLSESFIVTLYKREGGQIVKYWKLKGEQGEIFHPTPDQYYLDIQGRDQTKPLITEAKKFQLKCYIF